MQVVVTAASSVLGQEVLRALVGRGSLARGASTAPLRRILPVDRTQPGALFVDDRIEYVRGEYEQPRFLARMMGASIDSVFHLAALHAGEGAPAGAEGLDLVLRHSVQTTQALLEACGFQPVPPRLVHAGWIDTAAAGGLPGATPAVASALSELVAVEGARRGIVDLRCVRLAPGDEARAARQLIAAHEAAAAADGVLLWDVVRGGPAA